MTDARRKSHWHRHAPLYALGAAWVAVVGQGCSSDPETTNSTSTGTSTSTTTSSGAGGATSSSSSGTGGVNTMGVDVSPSASDAVKPFDSTPDSAAKTIYYTGVDSATGDTGVFSVAFGGGASTKLFSGAPLEAPFGIAISSDDKQLYIADISAEATDGTGGGLIFVLPTAGGTPTALAGTSDLQPRGIEVVPNPNGNGKDVVYFTGRDKKAGKSGLYRVDASGGVASPVASGAPFDDPSGVAIAQDGSAYVVDISASTGIGSQIIFVDKTGTASSFLTDIRVNYPAGLALTQDEKTLLVSGLDPLTLTDVVIQVDVSSKAPTLVSKTPTTDLAKNVEAAGIHRAKGGNVFSWADSTAGGKGTVYRVEFK